MSPNKKNSVGSYVTVLTNKQYLEPSVHETANPFSVFDDDDDHIILNQIRITHDQTSTHTKLDVHSLFTLVRNALDRSTHIVDNHVHEGSKVGLATQNHDNIPWANFSSPLCTLKQISSEMSCKDPSKEIAHETTLNILKKLSNYDWEAKAVLTIAAFAMEYGEFWVLHQHQLTDPLAKSVAVLKRVPLLISPAEVQKHHQAIIEVNNLVTKILKLIKFLLELLEKLTGTYDIKDVPALSPSRDQIPLHVYWSIITIAAIVSHIDCLNTDSEHKQDLSHYDEKISLILSKLDKQITLCTQQIEEVEYLGKIRTCTQTNTEIVEFFKILIFNNVDTPQQLLFNGATRTTVNINALSQKDVLLLISTLDITEEEISTINSVYNSIKRNAQYKIVWIPIVEGWNEESLQKFKVLKSKVPWYVVQNFQTTIVGYRFIMQDWHFQNKPIVVVLNPQSKVKHSNAFHLIQTYGMEAFPFTFSKEYEINQDINWFGSVVGSIHPKINTWIKEQKFIFFYGGKDKEWIQEFTEHAIDLANDAIIQEANISIELFCVEHEEDKSFIHHFWNGIEKLFLTKDHRIVDDVSRQVKRMLSYKNVSGWALLSKGPSVVLSGHGTTMIKAVAEFEKWKEPMIETCFEDSFKEYHKEILKKFCPCSVIEIPNIVGKLPETIKCPDCSKTMEIYIAYKCCHNNGDLLP